jgi:RHS repeat-associated protein
VSILYGWNPSTTLGVTDAGGNFQVAVPATGTFTVLLDGSTVSRPGVQYATVPVTVSVQAGVVNPLGYIPRLVPQARQTIPLVPGQETVLAPADIPGLEVRIPAGTTITGWDGQPNTQIGVVGVPIDRSGAPPLPAGVYAKTVYAYTFGKVGGGTPSQPVPITFPNDVGGNPGESLDLYYYDELPDGSQVNQWRKYGTGTVSADGTRVIPDTNPATGKPYGVPRFCCGYNLVINRTGWSDAGVAGSQVKAGEPVLLQTGIFLLEKTDLAVPGVPPLALTRTYRSGAPGDGPFGRGTSWTYDLSLLPPANGSPEQLRLILPGGSLNPFVRQPDGSFTAPGIPAFRGARITLEGPQRVLRFKDGAAWRFRTSDGLLASQTDRLGNTITITRDDATIGRALHIASATGQWLHLTYGGPEQPVIQVEDQAGRTVRYEYDGQRRLVAVTDPAGGVTRYTYDSSHRLLTITDPRAITFLVNEYDSAGRVFRQTQADTGIWQFAYTAPAGLITSTTVTDPRGQQTTSRFNAAGFLLAQTDALGQTTTYEREVGTNHLLSITDPLGRTSRYSYDPNGNVLTITNALNQTTTFTYEPSFNQVASITDPLGNRTTFAYDPQGNLLSITDPEQNQRPEADRLKTTFTYNPYGQPLTAADPLGHTTAFEYDAAGNLTATIDPLGNRTERGYDVVGRLVTQTDPLGNRTQFSYDPLNRLLALTDPLNGMTRFGYDPNGNLLTVTDAKGHTLTHEYDAMDRLHRRTDPLGKPETFQYDGNGNLVSTTDRKNQTSTFTYDGVNRRTKAEFADGAVATFTYDTGGRLTQAEDTADPHRPIAMTYDPLDRLLTETTTLGTVSYAYDALGRRTSMVVSGQAPVTYAYDANSRLTGLTQAPLTPVSLQYDAANRRTLLTLPNGVSTEYVYDLGSRLTALIYRNAQGTLGDLTYTYDPTGNRVGVGGSWARSLVPEAVTSASYDSANRQLSFGASTITFDDNGNLATLTEATGTTTYTWDSRNRLTGLAGSPVNASFAYDALGRRAHKIIGSAMTQFHYDGLHPVIEHGSSGPTPLLYGAGFDEIFRRGEAFYLVDSLQSVVALADAEGGLMTDYRYEPFGRAVSSSQSENPLQFIARENDGTGLTHHRLRYYSPTLHRFISQDPLGAWGGDRNLYAYALNSPVTLRDFVGGPAVAPIAAGLVIGKAIVGMISGGVGGYITSGSAAGTAVGALAGGLAGAATSPITSEAAGALATGAFSSAAGQLAGNLVEGKPMGSNFSVLAVAGAGAGSVLGTPVTAVVVPRAAQAVANIAGAAVSRPQALQVAGSAGASAGIMTQGIIDGAFTGLGESGGGKLQSAISTGRPSKAEPIPWPLPPGFPFAP